MMAFPEHRRWIISVFDQRSIMNRLYWHNQQVGYLYFIPFVWKQRGVIAAVADQTAMISHLLPMCWATRYGHEGMWARFVSQGSIALNWHSRYSGTRYSGTWLYSDSNWIQIVDFSGGVTLKFDGWPQKPIEHLFYAASSFVHDFKSINEFKLELQFRNDQLVIILSHVTLKFDGWPRK